MGFIVTAGEILAEILADTRGDGFLEAQPLFGPLPSGAPAIFIDQVGKLGFPCGMIGAVGADDFGRLNVNRLERDGVDISALTVLPDAATGSAFVRYRPSGERDFVFNIAGSASGRLSVDGKADAMLKKATHFHVMGSSVFSSRIESVMRDCVDRAKHGRATISFDPNVRKELLAAESTRNFFDWVLTQTDIFLPSGDEIFMFVSADDVAGAAAKLIAAGVKEVVVKKGERGASVFTAEGSHDIAGLKVDEVDPTGAGDCFGATYVTCRLLGKSLEDSLRYANAAGALQVAVRGPMEGTSSFAELDAFLADPIALRNERS